MTGEPVNESHRAGGAPGGHLVVVMGVSAAGKSTVSAAVASRLGMPWQDADELHPAASIAKMAAGEPLTDEDRGPWLDSVGEALAAGRDTGGCVIACSALRRTYRDTLRLRAPEVVFIHLTGPRELLAERAGARGDHFMPPSLLESQITILEPLAPDERGTEIAVSASVSQIADAATAWIEQLSR